MYPSDLKYDKEHEWVRVNGDIATVGISHFAQDQLGEVVYVDLPAPGDSVTLGEPFGEVESVKSVSELYAPVNGEVVKVNESLTDSPEIINEDPYGEGWMIEIEMSEPSEVDVLLSAEEYEVFVTEEE